MADWPLLGDGQRFETAGADGATSDGTIVPSDGSAHTKGAWTELLASTLFDAAGVIVCVRGDHAGSDLLMLDIGIGGAGVEEVLIPNLWIDRVDDHTGFIVYFPVTIPAGSRLSARCQVAVADTTSDCRVTCTLVGHGAAEPGLSIVREFGADEANTAGTLVDPGGPPNTKGSFAQISASVPETIRALVLFRGQRETSTFVDTVWLYDIAVGAASFEQVIVPDLFYVQAAGPNLMYPHTVGPFPVHIPAGSRLSMRGQCSSSVIPERQADFILYGLS